MAEEDKTEQPKPKLWNKRETGLLFKGRMVHLFFGTTEKGTIIPNIFYGEFLSKILQQVKSIVVLRRTKEIFIYSENTGKYEGKGILGKQLLYELIHDILGQHYREHRAKQVYESIITSKDIVKYREELNPPLNLIGFENGILDINKTPYKWLPHSPEYFFTELLKIKYNPKAKCKVWLKFLNSSFYPEDVVFLQQWVGSCLLREIVKPNWKCVVLHGPTRTGKSTFVHVLKALFGTAAVSVALHCFKDKYERYRFYGKLLNAHADISSNELHDTSWFKTVIAGDNISARTLYFPSIEFSPYTKHLFCCNNLPQTWDDTDAFWDRMRLTQVNREQFFPINEHTIGNLFTLLTAPEELSGILNWMLEGLQKYRKQGYYSNCPDAKETERQWKLNSNPQGAFMHSVWIKFVSTVSETKEDLYQHFVKFCESKKVTPWSKDRFGKTLTKYFVKTGFLMSTRENKTIDGKEKQVPCWSGIKIIPQTNEYMEQQAKEQAQAEERERMFDRVLEEGKEDKQ